jgi:spore coat polysaccharide biosynthesis protein SpsF
VKAVAIIQARVGSSRLPGKTLLSLAGETMLARVVARCRAASRLDEVVIATSTAPGDAAIVDEATRLRAAVYRGPEEDVLARYVIAANEARADLVVRVTADCPLLDPWVIDNVIGELLARPPADYASNTHVRSFPRGLDVEAFTIDTLHCLDRIATTPATREHVTSFLLEEPRLFRIRQHVAEANDADLRWTVDTPDDLALVRAIYDRIGDALVPYRELVGWVRGAPDLAKINAHVVQTSWRTHGHGHVT